METIYHDLQKPEETPKELIGTWILSKGDDFLYMYKQASFSQIMEYNLKDESMFVNNYKYEDYFPPLEYLKYRGFTTVEITKSGNYIIIDD